ncbi:MAG TPA: ParB/RepB/Spo0J family partition protein [Bryobacteraceae bacterium]|nr:ParB/RepB/Spo0J family partition protein [Bryobacteraceae bacterium]
MAIIATLKPVESSNSAPAQSIVLIPLNKLVPWDGNVRKTNPLENIEELAASIEALGILQSLVVRKASRGKFSVIAGRRRHAALSLLAEQDKIAPDHPVPCSVRSGGDDATEISLTENVVRAPMHPADQFVAFSELVESGSTPADIAARFGLSETAVKQRLKLARVSPAVFNAYKEGTLTLEQVQAFTVSDDHAAQDNVLENLSEYNDEPDTIRDALTENDIRASDKRAQFVTVAAYEEAGGAVRRDLFAEDDEGVFLLDSQLLDRLALEKLKSEAEAIKAEGWKWVEVAVEVDRSEMDFRVRRPEPVALSEEEEAERMRLAEEYDELFDRSDEPNEETEARLEAIESRIAELEHGKKAYSPETLAIAGALLTIRHDGTLEVMRGLVRPEDMPEGEEVRTSAKPKERPEFSAALVESLTAVKSAAIGAALSGNPSVALAAVVHALAMSVFPSYRADKCVKISGTVRHNTEESRGAYELTDTCEGWADRLPGDEMKLWEWCLGQDQDTLLKLLAFCAGCTVDAVQKKGDHPTESRLLHANALASALNLDMAQWFTPTAENYFSRVGRDSIVKAICEAKKVPSKRSWEKMKKAELAKLAAREVAGTGWLPEPLKA